MISNGDFDESEPKQQNDDRTAKVSINGRFKCQFCPKIFTKKNNCLRHEKSCSESGHLKQKIACSKCPSIFSRRDNLDAHYYKFHSSETKSVEKPCEVPKLNSSSSVSKNMVSSKKNYSFEDEVNNDSSADVIITNGGAKPSGTLANSTENEDSNCVVKSKPASIQEKVYPFCCHFCAKKFGLKNNCIRHERFCIMSPFRQSHFDCGNCSAAFTRKDNLIVHLRICHLATTNDQVLSTSEPYGTLETLSKSSHSQNFSSIANSKRKTPCLVNHCDLKFYHKESLINHLKYSHVGEVNVQDVIVKSFNSEVEFKLWIDHEEESSFSYFSQKSGTHNKTVVYYYCQHDGSSHCKRKSSRRNLRGRIKVGSYCIAKMKKWSGKDSKVYVKYYPTHSHVCKLSDFVHHPLSTATSSYVNSQLATGVSPSKIYKDIIKTEVPSDPSVPLPPSKNLLILTKKKLRDRARRLKNSKRLHKNEEKSVYYLAHELVSNDSVLLYKPYKHKVVIGPSEIDDLPDFDELFMLGLQTKRQAKLMEDESHRIVVVDETHKTNHHGYQLMTVMVVDERNHGWPVAHLITSKSDAATLQYFFKALHEKLPECHINTIITDDAPAIINGMQEGCSSTFRHLFCKWHIIKNWKDNLRRKVPCVLYEVMLAEMKALLDAKDESLFLKLSEAFVRKYELQENTKEFVINYFVKEYMNRCEKWAMCYRNFPHGNINTTGHVESFHNRLKKWHLKRKVNKRLDDLINILIQIELEDHVTRYRQSVSEFIHQPRDMIERHRRGLLIKDEDLENVCSGTWEVKSSSTDKVKYVTTYHIDICISDLCFSKCSEPSCFNLCSHLYSCSCPDKHPLCKHIHKLHSFLIRGVILENQLVEKSETQSVIVSEFEPFNHFNKDEKIVSKVMLLRLQKNVSDLLNKVSDENCSHLPAHLLSHADGVISELCLRFNNSIEHDEVHLEHMEPFENYQPNEKLKTQASQLSAFKNPRKRKIKKKSRNQSNKSRKEIVTNLLQYFNDGDGLNDENEYKDNIEINSNLVPATVSEYDTATSSMESKLNAEQSAHTCITKNFTPKLSYVHHPHDVILKYGDENISLLHFKSLEDNLPPEEEKLYSSLDTIFTKGWLYSSIVDAFLFRLSEVQTSVFVVPSEISWCLSNKRSNATFFHNKVDVQRHKIFLFPANPSGLHWIIVAVLVDLKEFRYYDPLQNGVFTGKVNNLLSQIALDLSLLYPYVCKWTVTVVNLPKQIDISSCGVYICYYGQNMVSSYLESTCFVPLSNTSSFRRKIFMIIKGGCLKRKHYDEETCGICHSEYSVETCEETVWICCMRCDQWFHVECLPLISENNEKFVCPQT